MSLVSRLLLNAQRNLYLDSLPAVGAKLDEFTVISIINQSYGLYGYATALAAVTEKGDMIIMFKGTDDLSDVIADIKSAVQESWPEVDPTGTAQFVNGLLDVFTAIFVPWLATIPSVKSATSITLTGHSAGATFALFAGMWLFKTLKVKPVIYTYAAPIFGNQAAKQLMSRFGIEIYDTVTENDPVSALYLPGFVRIGNGPTAPQRNYILKGPVSEPTLMIPANSNIPWLVRLIYVSRHSLITTYIPMLKNILTGQNGGVKCTYNASSVRHDPLKACSNASTKCLSYGALVPCGADGWCGSNGMCVANHVPRKCAAAKDCMVDSDMCITPGYHWPTTSWDTITETCKEGATCATNPWNLTKYCWNK